MNGNISTLEAKNPTIQTDLPALETDLSNTIEPAVTSGSPRVPAGLSVCSYRGLYATVWANIRSEPSYPPITGHSFLFDPHVFLYQSVTNLLSHIFG